MNRHHSLAVSSTPDWGSWMALQILLVEDDEMVRQIVGALTKQLGHQVTLQQTLQEAKTYLATNDPAPDLLLTDLNLEDGLGTDLLTDVPEQTKFVVMSGNIYGLGDELQQGRIFATLQKPFRLADLKEIFEQV